MRSAAESVHLVTATVGFLSLFLLWLAVLWGLILRNGWAATRIRHTTNQGIHQMLASLGLTLGAVHAFGQLAVPGGPVRLVDTVVPFLNPSDPVGLGAGVIALELLTAAALSILVRRRLGIRRWRALHASSYLAFALLVAHVLISGSDVGPVWVWGTVLGSLLATVALWSSTTSWAGALSARARDRVAPRGPDRQVSVDVDVRRCLRFGFCEQEAPEVFALRTDGRLAYRAAVDADRAPAVYRAADVCPARAITVGRLPATVLTTARPVPAPAHTDGRGVVSGLHRRGGRR